MNSKNFCRSIPIVLSLLMANIATAAYVNLTPTPIVANGAMVFAGNTIGLNKNGATNAPGGSGSIGTFIRVTNTCALDTTSTDGTFPAGTTSDWRLGGSCAPVDIPAGATVRQAVLIWSGSIVSGTENVTTALNNAVTLIKPDGTTVAVTPAAGATAQTAGNFYTRTADVTPIVTQGGTWGVRGIPATQVDSNTTGNTGGWTIAVIYELPSLPARAMSIFSGAEAGGSAAATVSGFCTPNTPAQSGRLMVSAVEGDSGGRGDEMRFAATAAALTTPAGLVSGPNSPIANFFASQINQSDGTLDTRGTFGTSNQATGTGQIGRQGYDITNVDVSTKLVAAQTSAVARGTTTGDQYMINALGIQVNVGAPSFPVTTKLVDKPATFVGDTLTYTIALQNTGSALATNVVFRDVLPAGLAFVPGSLTYQQTGAVAGALVTPAGADPQSAVGVPMPDIAVGDTYTVAFRTTVTAIPAAPADAKYDNSAKWDYRYQSCATSPVISSTAVTNPVTTRVPRLSLSKTVLPTGDVSVGDTLTYTLTTLNNGTAATSAATLADPIPSGTSYLPNTTIVNGASRADVSGAMPFVTASPIQASGQSSGVIPVGSSATVEFKVRVLAGATVVSNTATADVDGAGGDVAVSATTANTVKRADFVVAKSASGSFIRGLTTTYTVVVSNQPGAGSTDGTVVNVADTLPAGLELSAPPSGAGWTCTGATGSTSFSCTRSDSLSAGAAYPALTIPVLVLQSAPTSLTNTASVVGGGDTSTSTGSVTNTVASRADLEVKKTANPVNAALGQNVTFTVTVVNNGPSEALAVSVADAVPSGMTLVSATPSVGSYASGTWTVGTLAAGAQATFTMVATFNGGSATNTATATSTTPDPNTANNTASVSVPQQVADLQLLKSVDTSAPNVGGNVTFSLTVLNVGPDAASGVAVIDQLPAGLTFVSASPPAEYNSATGQWTIGSLAVNASKTLAITATVNTASPVTNVAQVSASNQQDPNSKPNNSEPTENDQGSVTLIPQSADLKSSKTVSNPNPRIGDAITYTITINNAGPSTAQNVVLTETLPAGLTFGAASASVGSYAAGTWTVGALAANAPATLTLNAIYTGPGVITNTVSVTSTTPDPNTSNNSSSQSVPSQIANLSLSKTADSLTPDWGGNVVFTVAVTNAGPSAASGVRVSDLLPAGLTFLSASSTQGTFGAVSGDWNVGSVAVGQTQTLTITARVDTTASITNTAEITKSDQFDPNSAPGNGKAGEDDIGSVVLSPRAADLSISKTASTNAVSLGGAFSYAIQVSNAGPSSAQNVTVFDPLPAGIAYVSSTPAGYDPASGVWTIGALASGASQTLTINATYTDATGAEVVNRAQVDTTTPDPNPTNNTAKAPVKGLELDLAVAKQVRLVSGTLVPLQDVAVGSLAEFVVTVQNTSATDAATNVKIADVLPSGVVAQSSSATLGIYASGSGLWFIPSIPASGSATLTVTVRLTGLVNQVNDAKLIGLDQFDTNASNNAESATIRPVFVDLTMQKTVAPLAPAIGEATAFTLTVTNLGPSNATGVIVNDLLPSGFTWTSDTSAGAYTVASGVWTIGSLSSAAGSNTASITINAVFNGPGPATNVATVSSNEPDTNATNNSASASVPSQVADLKIEKAVSNSAPLPNGQVQFTVTVTNLGPDTATAATVNDPLPPTNMTLVGPPVASQGSYASPTWTIGSLAAGASATLVATAQAGTLPATNAATVNNPGQVDPSTVNNTATASVTPQVAELSLTKTVDPANADVNDVVTFSITLTNAGPSVATNVVIQENLPSAQFAYLGSTASAGTYDPATEKWTIASLPVGTATLTLQARVLVRGAATNTVNVLSLDQIDTTAGNTANATVTAAQADLQMQKTASPVAPTPGSPVTFTMTVTNLGEDAATNVVVTDPLPAGFTLTSASPATYNSATGQWPAEASVANGSTRVYTLTGIFAGPGAVRNTASVSSDTFDPAAANNAASVTLPSQIADLEMAKTVDNATPNFGDVVTFTLTARNAGTDPATAVSVTDTLPAGLTYESHIAAAGTSFISGTGVWTIGNLAVGETKTLTLSARVTGTAPQTNTAQARADQFDPNTDNNTATAVVTPVAANLRIAKGVSNGTPVDGELLVYTLTVTNDGPSAATPVTVTDVLPVGLQFVSAQPGQGTFDAPSLTWNVGALSATQQSQLLLTVRYIANGQPATNTATASSPVPDPDPSDNTRSITVVAPIADLTLSKSVDVPNPRYGDNVNFSVSVTNNGPAAASGIIVRDQLPAGLTFIAASVPSAQYDPFTGNWQVGALANGASMTLTLTARVDTVAPTTNVAEVTKSDQYDPSSTPNNSDPAENDQASATITPQAADLRVSKSVDLRAPNNGESVTFTLVVTNAGPSTAPNVRVTDLLPPGMLYQFDSPSVGTYTPASGLWSVGALPAGGAASIQITAQYLAAATKITNRATGTSDLPDPVLADNSADASVFAGVANLKVTKSVAPTRPNVGDVVTYTITLTNDGPDAAQSVKVREQLPSGLTYVGHVTTAGSYADATGIWTVGTVAVGAPKTLAISARVTASRVGDNIAEVISSGQFDPDSAPNNAQALENDQASAPLSPQVADLSITKASSVANPIPGQAFSYTITVTNAGPDPATSVTVNDALPAGITFVSASASAYDAATGLWTIGTVAAGASTALTINVTYQGPGIVINRATVNAAQFDPTTLDQVAEVAVPSQTADLHVTKIVSNAAPAFGSNVTYTVRVENIGPDAATNVEILDLLPSGLTLVSSTTSAGTTYTAATGRWVIPSLANAATAELSIVATVQTVSLVTNVARSLRSDQFDPNTGNNHAEASISPLAADLSITKAVDNATPDIESVIRFTVTVINNGPGAASGVSVRDAVPMGVPLVSQSASVGTYDPATGIWTIGVLANGATATLTVELRVLPSSPSFFTNSAVVSGATPDLAPNNNSATVRINVKALPVPGLTPLLIIALGVLMAGIAAQRRRRSNSGGR